MDIKAAARIKANLERLRSQIRTGNESELMIWVIPGVFACSQRPLRDRKPLDGRNPLDLKAKPLIVEWVDRITAEGIKSVICLLENAQLEKYYGPKVDLHRGGLLGYYQSRGLWVRHYPLTDYQRPSQKSMEGVVELFNEAPKPVLMHCSAGIDRTTPVAAYIEARSNIPRP